MECYLENCANKSGVFDGVSCMQSYANTIHTLIQKMIEHSLAMEKRLEKEMERAGRFKQRLTLEQEKSRQMLKTARQGNKSLRKAESPFDDQAMKTKFKAKSVPGKFLGKENSSKKPVRASKSAQTLTTARKTPEKLLKSPEKMFKQQKISFAVKPPPKPIEETDGNDSTFCETLAPSGIEKSALMASRIEKSAFFAPENENCAGPSARSTPQRNPFCLETTDHEQLLELEEPVIKKEKLTQEEIFIHSDLDIFESDCEVMEADELPISIRDSNESGKSLVERLMDEVDIKEEDEVSSPIINDRRRKNFYAECNECSEFYDSYAERHGATQADAFIRDCPRRCKGYLVRVKAAEPKPMRSPMSNRCDETPAGFWNINPFTNNNDATPDL